MGPLVHGPGLGSKLAGQRVADFKEIHGVEAGPQPLVTLVVGHRVAHVRGHPLLVVPVEGLTHEGEVRLQGGGKLPQAAQVVLGQAVGHVQAQSVNVKLVHPAADGLKLVLHHRRVVQVQLHQLPVALPVGVPEAVVVVGVAVEVDAEPVLIGAVPPLFLHVPEGPEPTAHVVEHPVQHHPDTGLMEGVTHLGEVLVGAQAAVQLEIIPGIIAVAVAFKQRVEEYGVRPQLFDVLHPVQQAQNSALPHTVVVLRRATQPQRVDLIDD